MNSPEGIIIITWLAIIPWWPLINATYRDIKHMVKGGNNE